MDREREAKLSAAPAFRMPSFADLGPDVAARTLPPQRLETTYLDTDDVRLARWGVSLRHRAGQGWTVKLPNEGSGSLIVRPELVFPGGADDPPAAAVDLVRAFARTGDLRPVVRLRTVRRCVVLSGTDDVVLAEISDDEVSVYASSRLAARFRELEVEIGEATPAALLDSLVSSLRSAGAGPAEAASKYLRAIGPRGLDPSDPAPVQLGAAPTAADVLSASFVTWTRHLIRFDPEVRLGEDPEGVHQMRVAARHLHSLLHTFGPLTETSWRASISGELAWLARTLGAHRDADVMTERLTLLIAKIPDEDRESLVKAGIDRALIRSRDTARARALRALRSGRYATLLDRLVEGAAVPALTEVPARGSASLTTLAESQCGELHKRARAAKEATELKRFHRIRIEAKRCRYAAEALEPVVGKRARAFAEAAAGLQTVLGEQTDAVVMENWIRAWAAEPEREAEVAFAAGAIAQIERERAARARSEWRKAWKRLAKMPQPSDW